MRVCNNLPQPQKLRCIGIVLRKIVAYSHSSSQCLLVSIVFGTVSSLHPTSRSCFAVCASRFAVPGPLALDVSRSRFALGSSWFAVHTSRFVLGTSWFAVRGPLVLYVSRFRFVVGTPTSKSNLKCTHECIVHVLTCCKHSNLCGGPLQQYRACVGIILSSEWKYRCRCIT